MNNDYSTQHIEQSWEGQPKVKGPKWLHKPLLTLSLLGLQTVWSIELGFASPYLQSLGLSKAATALVFVAGPLSGLIMQPIIGAFADHSTSKYGRRRPYIISATFISALSILLLGYTRHVASVFTSLNTKAVSLTFSFDSLLTTTKNDDLTIILAVVAVYFIDFSINAVQAADRALIVDILPSFEQEGANAWAGRMIGIGSCMGFFVGNIDLTRYFSILGDTQLEILSSLTSAFMIFTHLLTCYAVSERVLISDHGRASITKVFKTLFTAKPPPRVRKLCIIQFFASMGWFPIMFWSTSYIGELYLDDTNLGDADSRTADEATRIGTRAMLFQAIVSLTTAIILPTIIQPLVKQSPIEKESQNPVSRYVKRIIPSSLLDLSSVWTFSHILFAITIFSTIFTSSYIASSVLIAIVGFTWALAMWAPFTLVGESILLDAKNGEGDYTAISRQDVEREVLFDENINSSTEHLHPPLPQQAPPNAVDLTSSSQAGIMLGILNVSMVIPQFLITGVASIIFSIMEPKKNDFEKKSASADFDNTNARGIGIVMRIGACAALIAGILSWRFTKDRLSQS
ncbi:MFS general substrate transporter [Wallemia mellicola]|nr:MFS general substrate transporter [Wallemia mellicola]TIC42462.1 MFS general substrate transporter [Wallemia mellicola]